MCVRVRVEGELHLAAYRLDVLQRTRGQYLTRAINGEAEGTHVLLRLVAYCAPRRARVVEAAAMREENNLLHRALGGNGGCVRGKARDSGRPVAALDAHDVAVHAKGLADLGLVDALHQVEEAELAVVLLGTGR